MCHESLRATASSTPNARATSPRSIFSATCKTRPTPHATVSCGPSSSQAAVSRTHSKTICRFTPCLVRFSTEINPIFQDDNQVNSANPHYKDLRARANQAGDAMGRCFSESKEAYQSGNGARAKELSNEGKRHQVEMEALNRQASEWIYRGM